MEWLGILNSTFLSERIVVLCINFAEEFKKAFPRVEVGNEFLMTYYTSYLIANELAHYNHSDDTIELAGRFISKTNENSVLSDIHIITRYFESASMDPDVKCYVESMIVEYAAEPEYMVRAMALRSLLFGDFIELRKSRASFTRKGRECLLEQGESRLSQ